MKSRKVMCFILMYFPIVCNLLSLPFLPDTIPAHFGADNVVNRWGSKYEVLILPFVIFIFGRIMTEVSQFASKKENVAKNNEKICQICTMLSLIIFNIINIYILIISFRKITSLKSLYFDFNQLIFLFVGLIMIIIGNLIPKIKMHSILGVRTKWSMKNEKIWRESQLFGGVSLVIAGALIIISALVFDGIKLYMISILILLFDSLACIYYTYKISKF